MPNRSSGYRVIAASLVAVVLVAGVQRSASAHSLESSTVAVRLTENSAEATISVALQTLDKALGTDIQRAEGFADHAADIISYLGDHLMVTGGAGEVWGESFSAPERELVEGIDTVKVDVTFETGNRPTTKFTFQYDAVIEAVSGHEVVVVLTDSNEDISTVGVLDDQSSALVIVDSRHQVPAVDMAEYGFHHVLDGADHLLFLAMLHVPAPLTLVGRRWQSGGRVGPATRRVLHIVTAFTAGHTVTLVLSALGWVSVPSKPVEVVIALSVGVSAIHVLRPLFSRGDALIAGGFGLVHGMAFAGILTDLGIRGSTSVGTLLAFNVGVELAQLVTIVLVFPSMYVLSKTRFYTPFRIVCAAGALLAAVSWVLDRMELIDNRLAYIEDSVIAHPWRVVGSVAALAAVGVAVERRASRTGFCDSGA